MFFHLKDILKAFIVMRMKLNAELLRKWIDENGPNGVAKLSVGSGVSVSVIAKMRCGFIPKRANTRRKIAEFLKIGEAELYLVQERKGRAS